MNISWLCIKNAIFSNSVIPISQLFTTKLKAEISIKPFTREVTERLQYLFYPYYVALNV